MVVVFFGYEGCCINKSHNAKPLRLLLLCIEIQIQIRVKKSRDNISAMTDVCLTFSLLMVTVASATLRATGVQSSLLEELIKLSIAPFSMSMPEAEEN